MKLINEDDYSIWEACIDMDQGGQGNNAPAMLAQGQNGYTAALRKRNRRQAKASIK